MWGRAFFCPAWSMISLGIFGAMAAGQTTRPASQPTTLPSPPAATQPAEALEPRAQKLIEQLASSDSRQRRRALEELVRLGEDGKSLIEQIIAHASSEEARKNAQAALVQIQQNRMLGPSYITLHVKNAAPKQVFAEIARQCFAALPTMPDNLWEQGGFAPLTLDVERQPFWQVMPQVCQHFGVSLQPYGNTLRLMRNGMQLQGVWKVEGPFLVLATQINYSRTRLLGQGQGQQTQFGINLSIYPEPKITVLRGSGTVSLDEVVDDRGNSLVPVEHGPRTFWGGYSGYGTSLYVPLRYPEHPGSKIVTFKGHTSFVIQTRMQRLQIHDVMNLKPSTRLVHGTAVTFQELKKSGDSYQLKLKVMQPNFGGPEWQELVEAVQTRLELLDAAGNPLDHRGMSSGGNNDSVEMTLDFGRSGTPDGRMTGEPSTLAWDIPVETQELTVPVEFHQLPLFD